MNDKNIENWIHGKLVIETDEPHIILTGPPRSDNGRPREILVPLPPEYFKYLNFEIKGKGGKGIAVELGLRRMLHIGRIVGGTALVTAAVAIAKGVPWSLALPGAGLTAVGSALVAGVKKTDKEIGKQGGATAASTWQILGGIIIEILKLIRELLSKEKKK